MFLEGILVDLVPYGKRFTEQEHRWRNNESAFWARVGDRRPLSRASLEHWRREHAERAAQRGRLEIWFGIQTKDGTPIGDIALNRFWPHHRVAMLGAAIGEPEYWGGGYGTDALLLVVDYAFDWLDLRRLWLQTMGSNVRVVRQMEKVGFTLETRQRQATYADGVWQDLLCYGLLREEWPGREALVERLGLRPRR